MLGTFRKHSTWLWGIIIAAMAVSLVFWTGNRGNRDGGGGFNLPPIAGKSVSPDEYASVAREVRLEHRFGRGEWPSTSADLDPEIYQRLFMIRKMEEMGIHISQADVARVVAQNLKAMSGKSGTLITTDMFEKRVLAEGGVTLEDYDRFLRHSLGVQQLIAAIGVSGQLVSEQEARSLYERENQDISVQAVFFSASNYLSSVTVTPTALAEFYTNQMVRYRLPDRIQVSYVEFKATNLWADVGADLGRLTNQAAMAELVTKYGVHPSIASLPSLDALLDAEYQRKTNFYTNVTPEKAKESIRAEIQHEFALSLARKQAVAFADPLLSAKEIKVESFTDLARKQGLPISVTQPFDRSQGPVGLNVPENFVRIAFALNPEEPVAGPVAGTDAVYVIASHKLLPSENPAFETVKAQVENDFKMFHAAQAARAAGAAFGQSVTNGLAQGKAFTSLCAEAKALPILLPPFSLSTRSVPEVESHLTLQQFKQVAFGTTVGQSSPFIPTMDGGVVLYVQSKLPLDEKKIATDLPEVTAFLRRERQMEAFNEWFSREARTALANTPALRPSPSQMNRTPRAN